MALGGIGWWWVGAPTTIFTKHTRYKSEYTNKQKQSEESKKKSALLHTLARTRAEKVEGGGVGRY